MGRIAEYTEKEIIDAGKSILDKGPVSTFAIRNLLGGGDSVRIKKVWNNYYSNEVNNKDKLNIITIDLPSELRDEIEINNANVNKSLENFAINSYSKAMVIADKRVESTIAEYKSKIAEFEESENQATIAIETCDKSIVNLNKNIDELKKTNLDLTSENSKLEGILLSSRETITKLENKEIEHEKLKQEHGKLLGKYEVLNLNTSLVEKNM